MGGRGCSDRRLATIATCLVLAMVGVLALLSSPAPGSTVMASSHHKCKKDKHHKCMKPSRYKEAMGYQKSKSSAPFDFGKALNFYGHRLCLLANQPSGNKEALDGQRRADNGFYENLALFYDKNSPYADDEQRCPDAPPAPASDIKPLKYKQVLFMTAHAAYNEVTLDPDWRSVRIRALYSESRRAYNRLRKAMLKVRPKLKLLTFDQFEAALHTRKVKLVAAQPLEDPPPCKQSGTCGQNSGG